MRAELLAQLPHRRSGSDVQTGEGGSRGAVHPGVRKELPDRDPRDHRRAQCGGAPHLEAHAPAARLPNERVRDTRGRRPRRDECLRAGPGCRPRRSASGRRRGHLRPGPVPAERQQDGTVAAGPYHPGREAVLRLSALKSLLPSDSPMEKGLYERCVKRAIDVFLSGLSLIVLSPVLVLIACLVRVKLGSPVIFVQERAGMIDPDTGAERIFRLYKFRSMSDRCDKSGQLLPDDMRITRFGRILRATSLDELPELWNILKGDMSIVGPRPLLVQYLPLYNEFQKRRHEVRSGLTGYAQVHGRNAITWEEKFRLDVYYVDHVSFLLDIMIILETIKKVFIREGIHGEGTETMEPFRGEFNERE